VHDLQPAKGTDAKQKQCRPVHKGDSLLAHISQKLFIYRHCISKV